jgi:MFS family permease
MKKVRSGLLANFWRYSMSGFVMNLSSFFFWVLVPLVADDLGTSPGMLGSIQAVSSAVYAALSIPIGIWVMDRFRVGWLVRVAVVLFLGGSAIALVAKYSWMLLIAAMVLSCGTALFWTPLQTAVGNEAGAKSDSRMSLFSSFHSFGKAVGFVAGGWLKGILGTRWAFGAMMIFDATILVFSPIGQPPKTPLTRGKKGAKTASVTMVTAAAAANPTKFVQLEEDRPSMELSQPPTPPPTPPPPSPPPQPTLVHPGGHEQERDTERLERARSRVFLWLSWFQNFSIYGTAVTIAN